MKNFLSAVLLIVLGVAYSYLLIACATWLICIGFNLDFTWMRAFFLWLAFIVVNGAFRVTIKGVKDA